MNKTEDIQNTIITLLNSTRVTGVTKLIKAMIDGGFFIAPCSEKHHLCYAGGLAEHSLNVFKTACELDLALNAGLDYNELVLACILHDLGKMGDHGKLNYLPNILKSGEISEAQPYKVSKELLAIPHEIRSVAIAERYIRLSEEVEHAILMHNGLYGDLKYAISGKETPLYLILHFADMWCSRVTETKKGD